MKNLLIVGAMKCGTTSLREMLREAGIFFGPGEEHFWNSDHKRSKYAGYRDYICKKYSLENTNIFFGDDTPSYSYMENIFADIKTELDRPSIIFIVRDPLKRAVSNYWHAVRRGAEYRDINSAFEASAKQEAPNIWLDYLKRSQYSLQYENMLKYFSPECIHLVSLESLITDFDRQKVRLESFLGISISAEELPSVNSRTFHGRPVLNYFFGPLFNRNYAMKAIAMSARFLFGYRRVVPVLSEENIVRSQGFLSLEYDFLERIDAIK